MSRRINEENQKKDVWYKISRGYTGWPERFTGETGMITKI